MHGIIVELFSQLTKELCAYLGCVLPRLSDHWWTDHVLAQLSFQQLKIVEQHRASELFEFDLEMFHKISFSGRWAK